MKSQKLLLLGGIVLIILLVKKSIKQFIYLSFTLLTLKFAWILLVLVFILFYTKKRIYASRHSKK